MSKIKITDEKELAAFQQFKLKVEDLNLDNDIIIRFLRARQLDLEKAEELLRNDVKWRVENKISEYLHWTPSSPLFVNPYPMICTGVDNDGNAVIFAPMGKWNTREKMELGLRPDLEASQFHMLENIMNFIGNAPGSQMVFIIDQTGATYWKVAHMETALFYLEAFKIFEQHYPEILSKAVIINASWLFTLVINFLKPAFSGTTASKIQVFNSDRAKYRKALLELMTEETLPPCCKDP